MEEQNAVSPFGQAPNETVNESDQQSVDAQLAQIAQGNQAVAEVTSPEVSVKYAGFWIRVVASLIDSLVIGIPLGILTSILGNKLNSLGTFLMWAYAIYMLNDRQATLGKMALRLKVVAADGERLTLGKIALREIVGKILSVLTLGIGYLMVAFTQKKQGLHDLIVGSVVIYDPEKRK